MTDEPLIPAPDLPKGLKLDEAYALGLSDGTCPVCLILSGDKDGVVVSRVSFMTGFFSGSDEWISAGLIMRWLRAEKLTPPSTPDEPWSDGYWRSSITDTVFQLDPLGDFQTTWHERAEQGAPR